MKCPSCNAEGVLVESLQEGKKRIKCTKCGLNEVRDREGRKLLLDAPSTRTDTLLS
jgi:ribosomal protein S27AE